MPELHTLLEKILLDGKLLVIRGSTEPTLYLFRDIDIELHDNSGNSKKLTRILLEVEIPTAILSYLVYGLF